MYLLACSEEDEFIHLTDPLKELLEPWPSPHKHLGTAECQLTRRFGFVNCVPLIAFTAAFDLALAFSFDFVSSFDCMLVSIVSPYI